MARFLHPAFSRSTRKFCVILLALSWILGLFFGALLFRSCGATLVSLMPMAVTGHVSIVSTLIPFLLPFLFSALAVYLCLPLAIPAVCFCKAFSFAFVCCGVLSCYGSAGWLVQLLLMFTDLFAGVLLWVYWLRHTSRSAQFSLAEVLAFLLAALAVAGVDYFVISSILYGVFKT